MCHTITRSPSAVSSTTSSASGRPACVGAVRRDSGKYISERCAKYITATRARSTTTPMSSSVFSLATASRRTGGSVAVRPPAIISRPFIIWVGNAGAADATRADQALLQRVIGALHHPAGDLVALIAPLRRPGQTLTMRTQPAAVGRHRNRRSGQHRKETQDHAPHRYLLLSPHLRIAD